jgi:hypothetical protein
MDRDEADTVASRRMDDHEQATERSDTECHGAARLGFLV